jgi:hypothetical protein
MEMNMEASEALAELFRQDDTLRFRVQAQKTIPQEDVRISVEVSALVSTTRPADEALEARSALPECGTWGTFAGANTLAVGLNVNFSALP